MQKFSNFKVSLTVVTLLASIFVAQGCTKKVSPQTPVAPQLQAALSNDKASIALNVFCKQETLYKSYLPAGTHKAIQEKCLAMAQYDDKVTEAIAANDLTSASKLLNLAVAMAGSLSGDLISVKDSTSQEILQIAQAGLLDSYQQWGQLLSK